MNKKNQKEYIQNLSVSLIDRMKETSAFSEVDLTIITYLFNHLNSISNLTVTFLSKAAYVSTGSIVRFTKKLGYDGFTSFKLDLIKDMESRKYIVPTVDFKTPFNLNSSAQNIINSMSSLYKESIDIAQSSLDARQLEQIASLILKSKRLILFGIGDSLTTCESFINKLKKIGILAFSATENSDAECIVDIMTESDLAIFVTYSASSPFLIRYGQKLKKNNVPFIVLSANPNSPLVKISSESILFKDMEGSSDEKIATFYSQLIFNFVLNSIYSLLYSKVKSHI